MSLSLSASSSASACLKALHLRAASSAPTFSSISSTFSRRSFTTTRVHFHFQSSFSTAPPPISKAHSDQKLLQKSASLSPVILILAATAVTAGLAYYSPYNFDLASSTTASNTTTTTTTSSTMSGSVVPQTAMPAKLDADSLHAHLLQTATTQPPGRPGNLTPEQTLKLKECWARLLEIFGQYTVKPGTFAAAPAPEVSPVAEKKSGGFWGSSQKAEAAPADNDKHGQGRTYQKALDTMTPEELQTTFYNMTKQDSPDAAILRYLRARKWDVQAALIMLVSTLHWRAKEMHIDDDLMEKGEAGALKDSTDNTDPTAKKEAEDFIGQFRMGKSFVHGYDKKGRPCNYVRVKLHRGGEQTVSSIERFTVFLIETTRFMILPPNDTGTIVFDMTGFSMANMDYTPVKFMIKCFEANYPETLGSVVIYKAPWLFQGIWRIIKGWLDPVVAAKIYFANNIKEMSEYIDPQQVTKECDGTDSYVYQYIEPVAGENEAMSDTATRDKYLLERREVIKSYSQSTIQWIEGQDVNAQRSKLAFDLHLNYYRLDPYIRARSMYDRLGLIRSHNQLGWDKSAVESALA